MRLFITRHGETYWNTKHMMQGIVDSKLSSKGRGECVKLAKRLRSEHFDHIYSSPLNRALWTAEVVAKYHPDVPFETVEDLRERDFGEFEGKTKKEIGWNVYPHPEPKEGESSFEAIGRAGRFLTRLLKKHKKTDVVLIVAHKHINSALIGAALGADWNSIYDMTDWGNTSITVVDIEKFGEGEILVLNDVKHLG